MKLFVPTLLATATTLALWAGGPAVAQMQHKDATAPHGQMSEHKGEHRADGRNDGRAEHRAAHRSERQQKLKTTLKLTAAQEAAWAKYVQAQQRPHHSTPPDRQTWAQLTTPQRLDLIQARRGEHDAHMAHRIEATRGLYTVLDAEQQKTFDSLAPNLAWGSGMAGGMGRGGKQHRGHGHHGMHQGVHHGMHQGG